MMLTPGQEQQTFVPPRDLFMDSISLEQRGVSKLGDDLVQMLVRDQQSADVQLAVENGEEELRAHSCILWANGSTFFREQLARMQSDNSAGATFPSPSSNVVINLGRYSRPAVQFLLKFLYGGVSCLPMAANSTMDTRSGKNKSADAIAIHDREGHLDLWELLELGAYTRMPVFIELVVQHIRAVYCHFFHRPCAACVSAVFEALPKMNMEILEIQNLYEEAMHWQAMHFQRIWKGRVFLHLSLEWQQRCRDALLQAIDEENVIEVLLGCEKLQLTLPRIKLQVAAQKVLQLVMDVQEYCMEFLVNSLDLLLQSKAFSTHGKGLALNLSLLEDILPPIVHSLLPEATIRAFVTLKALLRQIEQQRGMATTNREQISLTSSCTSSPVKKLPTFGRSSLYGSNISIWREQLLMDEWNPRFTCFCHRLLNLLDRRMLHYANTIVNSTDWALLTPDEQSRVIEYGLFVEMQMPRVAPPRFVSSAVQRVCNKKQHQHQQQRRSASVGIAAANFTGGAIGTFGIGSSITERAQSLERNDLDEVPLLSSADVPPHGTRAASSRKLMNEGKTIDNSRDNSQQDNEPMKKEETQEHKRSVKKSAEPGGSQRTAVGPTKIPAKIFSAPREIISVPESRQGRRNKTSTRKNSMEESESGIIKAKRKSVEKIRSVENGQEVNDDEDNDDHRHMEEEEMEVNKNCYQNDGTETQPHAYGLAQSVGIGSGEHAAEKAAVEEKILNTPRTKRESPFAQTVMSERQRTHTVMTVNQNLQAGINAYLLSIGAIASPPTTTTIPTINNNNNKPQSIVRPMPKEVGGHAAGEGKQNSSAATQEEGQNDDVTAMMVAQQTGSNSTQSATTTIGQQQQQRAARMKQQQHSKIGARNVRKQAAWK